ncbi:MAG: hypothetical protein QW782_06095, partial [Candidatus Bathyarchaeia archaeon]
QVWLRKIYGYEFHDISPQKCCSIKEHKSYIIISKYDLNMFVPLPYKFISLEKAAITNNYGYLWNDSSIRLKLSSKGKNKPADNIRLLSNMGIMEKHGLYLMSGIGL